MAKNVDGKFTLEECRINIAWFSLTVNPASDLAAIDRIFTIENQVLDYSERFDLFFTFNKVRGVIDRFNYVQWGGMGLHLESIWNLDFLFAIKDQTGIAIPGQIRRLMAIVPREGEVEFRQGVN